MFRYEKDMQAPVIAWLEARGFLWVREGYNSYYCPVDFVAARFEERTGRKRPALIEGMIIELKMTDVGNVLAQAIRNREFAHASYAAMPVDRCRKLRPATLQRFADSGVGLLAVSPEQIEELVAPIKGDSMNEKMVTNLWRRVVRRIGKAARHTEPATAPRQADPNDLPF